MVVERLLFVFTQFIAQIKEFGHLRMIWHGNQKNTLTVENKKNENKVISNNNNNIPKKERDEIDTEKNKNKNKDNRYTVVRSKRRKPVVKKIKMDESHKGKGKYAKRIDRTYVDEVETSNTKMSWSDVVKRNSKKTFLEINKKPS